MKMNAKLSGQFGEPSTALCGATHWSTTTPIYCLFCDRYYSEAEDHQGHFERSNAEHCKASFSAAAGDEVKLMFEAENRPIYDEHQVAISKKECDCSSVMFDSAPKEEGQFEHSQQMMAQSGTQQNQLSSLRKQNCTLKLITFLWMTVATLIILFYVLANLFYFF